MPKLPELLRPYKDLFLSVFDDASVELIGRKVAKMNGDVRVAFDLIKTCFNKLYFEVLHA